MLKKFLTSLSTVLMVIAFAIAVLFGWSKTGWKALAVPTGSMQPNISQNSMVVVHHVDPKSLAVGDVITYMDPRHAGQTVTHRIIKTYTLSGGVPAFVTKGDANKVPDIPVTSGSVVGQVVWHAPHLGSLMMGAKTWVGIALAVYLPAILLMAEEVRRMTNYLKLSIPYKLYGYKREERRARGHAKYIAASTVAGMTLLAGLVFGMPAFALLTSNTVSLNPNILTTAGSTPPATSTCSNNTNVHVSNTSNQTASSGTANNSNNTSGGNATSGNASNSNSTNVTVTVNNGC